MEGMGKLLIIGGVVLVVVGIAVSMGFRGLPGDVHIKKDNFNFFFPITTSILFSLVLSIILYLASRR